MVVLGHISFYDRQAGVRILSQPSLGLRYEATVW